MKLDQTPIADLQSIAPERLPAYYKSTPWKDEIGEIEVHELQGGADLAYQPVPGINSDISLQGGGSNDSSDSSELPSDSIPAERAINLSNDLSSSTCDIPTQLSDIGNDGVDTPASLMDRRIASSDEESDVPLVNKRKRRKLDSFANLRTEANSKRQRKQKENDEVGDEDDGFELDLRPQLQGINENELLADDFDRMLEKDWHPRTRQTMSRSNLQSLVKESTQLSETEEDDILALKRLKLAADETMKDAIGDLANEYDGDVQSLLDVDIEAK
ncbi:hypothetical protein HDV05_002121, partial [Chytridiales sp. JEL 0842]